MNAVDELAQCARGDGAQEIFVFATSAVRDAANGRAFTDRCEAACGARVPFLIVQARHSSLPAVRNEMRPSSS